MNENSEEKKDEEKIEELPQEEDPVKKLEESLKDCQDKYLRVLAESENARKRMLKERVEMARHAVESVLVEFLHPLDSFEKALGFATNLSDEVKNWALGFSMILDQFKQVLSNHDIRDFESVGKHFDPHLHEALEVVETDEKEPGIILTEFVRGYRMGERILRVAKVKVAKAPPKESQKD